MGKQRREGQREQSGKRGDRGSARGVGCVGSNGVGWDVGGWVGWWWGWVCA